MLHWSHGTTAAAGVEIQPSQIGANEPCRYCAGVRVFDCVCNPCTFAYLIVCAIVAPLCAATATGVAILETHHHPWSGANSREVMCPEKHVRRFGHRFLKHVDQCRVTAGHQVVSRLQITSGGYISSCQPLLGVWEIIQFPRAKQFS